jgi:hypothetical protein
MLRNDILSNEEIFIDSIPDNNFDYIMSMPFYTVFEVDIDGDGDMDIIYCDRDKGIRYIENNNSKITITTPNKSNHDLVYYPNPTQDWLSIKNVNNIPLGKGSILDISGRQIKSFEFKQTEIKLDLSDLQAGFYFINWNQSNTITKVIKK